VSIFLGRDKRAARRRHALHDVEFARKKHQTRDSLPRSE
jgi:hypothetical protein